jgi:hypothetical protein
MVHIVFNFTNDTIGGDRSEIGGGGVRGVRGVEEE